MHPAKASLHIEGAAVLEQVLANAGVHVALQLERATIKDRGRAKKIVVSVENSTIFDGAGEAKGIQGRVRQI